MRDASLKKKVAFCYISFFSQLRTRRTSFFCILIQNIYTKYGKSEERKTRMRLSCKCQGTWLSWVCEPTWFQFIEDHVSEYFTCIIWLGICNFSQCLHLIVFPFSLSSALLFFESLCAYVGKKPVPYGWQRFAKACSTFF